LKKPRIKISLKDGGKKKKAAKPKKSGKSKKKKVDASDAGADEGNHGDGETTTAPKRKRKRSDKPDSTKKISRKRTKTSEATLKPSVSEESPQEVEALNGNAHTASADGAIYLDVDLWKAEREALDGSFEAARAHFLERGPWQLPGAIGNGKFRTVAKQTLIKMGR